MNPWKSASNRSLVTASEPFDVPTRTSSGVPLGTKSVAGDVQPLTADYLQEACEVIVRKACCVSLRHCLLPS